MKSLIYIPIEIGEREAHWKIELGEYLRKDGFKVIIGYKPLIQGLALRDQRIFYLDKGYHNPISDAFYKNLSKQHSKIISLDEEGAIDWNNGSSLKNRYPPELPTMVDWVFMWGEHQKTKYYLNAPNVLVTGHPRFARQSNSAKTIGIDSPNSSKISKILLITNSSFGNNQQGLSSIKSKYQTRVEQLDDVIHFDNKKTSLTNELIKHLETDYNLTIRTHPEENKRAYKSSKSTTQFSCHSLEQDLAQNDLLLHFDSTVAIDALPYALPVISLTNIIADENSNFVCGLPVRVSDFKPFSLSNLYKIIALCPTVNKDKHRGEVTNYFRKTSSVQLAHIISQCTSDVRQKYYGRFRYAQIIFLVRTLIRLSLLPKSHIGITKYLLNGNQTPLKRCKKRISRYLAIL